MRQSTDCEGFVLKKRLLLNQDLVVTIFTQSLGRINVFAHGVRKITSRRLPQIETGNLIKFVVSRKNERFYLQETKLISGFSEIKKNQEKLNALYTFLFVLEKILPENQKEENVYYVFRSYLINLSKSKDVKLILNIHLNQMLRTLGYIEHDLKNEELMTTLTELIAQKLPQFNI